MTDKSSNALQQEWNTLHNNVEQSEALALLIKLIAVMVCLLGIVLSLSVHVIALLLLVLWFQESIWKTFQSRTESRLLDVEQAWTDGNEALALSFYSNWVASRPGHKALLRDYLSNLARPTVAYPYLALIPLAYVARFF